MTQEKPELPLNIQIAIENTVGLNESDKKWDVLAKNLGMTPGVLRNKVASAKEDKRHHLSLAEAIAMVKASNNDILVHAICKEFGGEFLHLPDLKKTSDDELLSHYTSMMKELGHFSDDIHKSLADGKISHNEIVILRKDFLRLSGALTEIMDRLQARANSDAEIAKHKAHTKKIIA